MIMLNMEKLAHADIYCVGGYVRDRLLNREPHDHDFAVCGATVDDMLAAGFIPIEASAFPVFHHPITKDEFALARSERKTGTGYYGFECFCDPSLTIEDDLVRRDVTVNSMARKVVGWNEIGHAKLSDEIIDPFGGQDDLKDGILRHVSDAFKEDSLRVLRVARFAARYNFRVAAETTTLMKHMVRDGELDHLVPERIWSEMERALMEQHPVNFFTELNVVGAAEVIFGEAVACDIRRSMETISIAATFGLDFHSRVASMFISSPAGRAHDALRKVKAPNDVSDFVKKCLTVWELVSNFDSSIFGIANEDLANLFRKIDLFRSDEQLLPRIGSALMIMRPDAVLSCQIQRMLRAGVAAREVSFNSLSDFEHKNLRGSAIGDAIDRERLEVISRV